MGRSRAVAALVACSLVTAPVYAQPAPPAKPTDAQVTQAKDLVNKAKDKSTAGDHLAAIDLYLQAYTIAPLPLLLSNVAAEFENMKKPVEALKYFCKYLEAEPDGPMASYATSHAKDLQNQLRNPVDDQNVCKPASAITQPPPPTGSGSDHTPPPPPIKIEDPGRTLKLAGLSAGGAGVVGLALGLVFGVKAKNISDSITNHDKTKPWPDNIVQIQNDGHSDQTKQIAFLVLGGALVAGGAVIYVMGRNKTGHGASSEHPVALAPVATPSSGGFVLSRAW